MKCLVLITVVFSIAFLGGAASFAERGPQKGASAKPPEQSSAAGKKKVEATITRYGLDNVKKLADAKDPYALWIVGYLHNTGEHGFEKDSKKAESYLFESANAGYAPAQLAIANVVKNGNPKNQEELRFAYVNAYLASLSNRSLAKHAKKILPAMEKKLDKDNRSVASAEINARKSTVNAKTALVD